MSLYEQCIHDWERRLSLRDRNRRILPFEWGLDWIGGDPGRTDSLTYFRQYAADILQDSDSFYRVPPIQGVSVRDATVTFVTPTPTRYPENNTVYCRLFPSHGSRRAVVVAPQWNARAESHVTVCRILQALGITAARLTLPYHERRLPRGMERSDCLVSPNIGRTLHANRQGVLEIRQTVSWLQEQGYTQVAVLGTSIGSCLSYLAFVHEPTICAGVFNHVSAFFADAVWTGLATRYVRWGLEGHISPNDLRICWAPISPWYFVDRLRLHPRPHLLITARYDLTFLPELTERMVEQYQTESIAHQRVVLPCGHYTSGVFPFSYLDAWHVCRFLRRTLDAAPR